MNAEFGKGWLMEGLMSKTGLNKTSVGVKSMTAFSGNEEPSLDELLSDPVTEAVMARDGLSRDDVRNAIQRARAGLRG